MEQITVLSRQFGRALDMLEGQLRALPEDGLWQGDVEMLVPSRVAYHAIETVDFYFGEDLSGFAWGGRFDADWEGAPRESLPDRAGLLDYLEVARGRVDTWLGAIGEEGLLAPDPDFGAEGMTALDRFLYVLRHTHQHTGELATELRRREIPRPTWR